MASKTMSAIVLSAVLLPCWGAAAGGQTGAPELPAISRCPGTAHPALPERWHATYLMAPFIKTQLVLGGFTFDGSIPAVKIGLYGVRGGSAELLVKGRQTYLLAKDGVSEDGCLDLGDTGLRPPPRDWLAFDARCDGHAPIGGRPADWWKMASGFGGATRMWFDSPSAAPFRLMFVRPAPDPAILGGYAFSYRVRFEDLSAAPRGDLALLCKEKSRRALETGPEALRKLLETMEHSRFRANAGMARLMPELSACPAAPAPRWPERAVMTAFITTPNFDEKPRLAQIDYDWRRRALRTEMFEQPGAPVIGEAALLLGGHGYHLSRIDDGRPICGAGMAGVVRPDWPRASGCSCEAEIRGMTPLTPFGPARIMRCPMGSLRVLWSWFAAGDRPQAFMQTFAPDDDGTGYLAVVDYHSWMPGSVPREESLKAPAQCPKPDFASQSELHSMGCGVCHLNDSALPPAFRRDVP